MNKKLIVGMLAAFMAMAPWCGYAAQTIDSPHSGLGNENSDLGKAGADGSVESCIYCHNQAELSADNECKDCHTSDTGPYGTNAAGASIAPFAKTHADLDGSKFKCTACHNPHVSLQETTLTGNFTVDSVSYDAVTGKSTLTGLNAVPDTNWVTKSGVDPFRGLILWVVVDGTTTPPDMASYEVQSIVAGATGADSSVTVQGNVPLSIDSFDLQRGQLIAKKVTRDTTKNYREGDLAVQFPSPQGNTSIYINTGTGPKGICQVCHTQTAYWRSDGTLPGHNADQVCTTCHRHSSGFILTECTACHTADIVTNPDGAPLEIANLAKPETGSATAGMHAVHATTIGADGTIGYNYPCVFCHTGTGMDSASDLADYRDGIQIGFKTDKYPQGYFTSYNGQRDVTVDYVGTNHTTVTKTGKVGEGNLTCSNVYCHSNGKSIRLGCATSIENTSPAWDGLVDSDTKCNNCHGYARNIANPIASGTHITHVSGQGIPCAWCHAATVNTSGAIIDRTKHANGVYDLKASGTFGTPINFTYNLITRTCTNMTGCHGSGTAPYAWGKGPASTNPPDTETCIPKATVCDPVANPDALVNEDPILAWDVVNLDHNTLMITDRSIDNDRLDPVKALCQGGGFNGSAGYVRWPAALDTKFGNVTNSDPLDGSPAAPPLVRTYRPGVLDISDPTQPRAWVYYQVVDNTPQALANWAKPDQPGDGCTTSEWFATIMQPKDMAVTNALPLLDYSVTKVRTGPNTTTFTVTNLTIDPDANDPDKRQYFGGGHDGSTGFARVWFLNTADADRLGKFKVVNYDNTVPLNDQITFTVYGPPGKVVWWQMWVKDNHYVNAAAQAKQTSYEIDTGWLKLVLP